MSRRSEGRGVAPPAPRAAVTQRASGWGLDESLCVPSEVVRVSLASKVLL